MQILKSEVRFDIILYSLPFGLFANIVRGYRWNLLIKPLGYSPKKSNLVYAVLGNYAVNLGVPRLGEVWRCSIITRYEKIPFTKLFGTLLIDRLSDTISVGIIVVVAFIMNISYFEAFFIAHPEYMDTLNKIITSVWTYTTIILIAVSIWVTFRFFKHTVIIKKIGEILLNIWEGIRTIKHMKERGLFLFYTFLIWLGYFLYFYICFFAFDFTKDLGWQNGVIAFGMSSLAVAIPAQVGPWHVAVIATLMGFGIGQTNASAFALCVHTVQQIIFTGLVGLGSIFVLSIINKEK
ncbi:dolichol-P-glucose synthetase [Bacteroidia bacterium]|nr:dolichol-P-glucose synthetase [Bacteroidia bacterium]